MTRKCDLTGKLVITGNNVSHANNKTKRRFIPNLQNVSLYSDKLGKKLKFRIATSTLRTIEKNGGIDNFLLNAFSKKLSIPPFFSIVLKVEVAILNFNFFPSLSLYKLTF